MKSKCVGLLMHVMEYADVLASKEQIVSSEDIFFMNRTEDWRLPIVAAKASPLNGSGFSRSKAVVRIDDVCH